MFRLDVEDWFSSAHQLRGYKGKCENLHGHNWRVRLTVEGQTLGPLGMLVDFGDLKKILRALMDRLDHKFLNEVPPFDQINPTSEQLAAWLAAEVAGNLPAGVGVAAVTVWESEKCSATYLP